jgi:DNA polymerase zeta
MAEARWWDQLRQRIERERDNEVEVRDSGWERWIMTIFESVEALWENEYRVRRPIRGAQEQNPYADSNGSSPQDAKPVSQNSVEVDEALIFSQELSALEEQGDAAEGNIGNDDKGHLTDDVQEEDADPPGNIRVDKHSRRGTPQPPQGHHPYDVPFPQTTSHSDEHSTTPLSSQQSNKAGTVTPRKRGRAFLEAATE